MVVKLPGNNMVIDDTYNCNPMSLEAALKSVNSIGKGMKIIIGLGEMLELGDETERAHIKAGKNVSALSPDYFVAMGEHAPEMIKGAREGGMDKSRTFISLNHDFMSLYSISESAIVVCSIESQFVILISS